MSTVQTVLNRALQKLGVISAGNNPEASDNALALQALKGLFRHYRTSGAFGKVYEVLPTLASYTVLEGDHVIRSSITTQINLPDTIAADGDFTDYGVEGVFITDQNSIRPPRDMSYASITDQDTGLTTDYIYDGQIAQWICVETLTYNSICPLSFRDENGLAACLAMHVADEFGQQPTELIMRASNRFEEALAMNWSEAGQAVTRIDYN